LASFVSCKEIALLIPSSRKAHILVARFAIQIECHCECWNRNNQSISENNQHD